MKRALLLGAGTIVGTAAVLAYHPGSLFGTGVDAAAATALASGTTAPAPASGDAATAPAQSSASTQPADATSQPAPLSGKATTSKKSSASSAPSQSQTPSQSQSQSQSQAQAQPQTAAAAPAPAAGTSGTFTGAAVQTRYGAVQVQITVDNGKVTGAVGQQAATDGRSQMIASVAIPRLEQQAVAAQSANINGVSGASYTSGGFAQSLQSALQQAGLG